MQQIHDKKGSNSKKRNYFLDTLSIEFAMDKFLHKRGLGGCLQNNNWDLDILIIYVNVMNGQNFISGCSISVSSTLETYCWKKWIDGEHFIK